MSELKLTKAEQETIITFSVSDTTANIYTTDPVWERKIQKIEGSHKDGVGWSVDVPKKLISIRKEVVLTEEQKQKSAERLKKARQKINSVAKSPEKSQKKNSSN